MKKLLIVSTAYNEEDNIEEFINQIKFYFNKFNENYNYTIDLELIIANNKSKDNTLKKLKDLKKKHSFLRVFNNKANYGPDISLLNILKPSNVFDFFDCCLM